MTSLELPEAFDTSSVTNMSLMFAECGYKAMTSLDLGPAFTKIADTNAGFITDTTGKSGCVIYAPESIYSNKNALKLSSTETETTISYTSGTIVPKYKPEWTHTSELDNVTNPTKMTVTLKGSASYGGNVTTTLELGDITVFVNGEEASHITKALEKTSPANSSTGAEVIYKLTLSGFEEEARQTGKPFKEWSGNIQLNIGGRGKDTTTYTANVLKDAYGNQSMMETDQNGTNADGTWINVLEKDADSTTNVNTSGTMFIDNIKPEFTYEYANTTIGNGNNGGSKNVSVVFDVTDKYFNNATINGNDITIKLIDTDPNTTITESPVTKTLAKKTRASETTVNGVTYKTNGDIYYNGAKVGERYELVISGLDRGDGFTYSGPMSVTLPANVVTDKTGNKNAGKTITIGIDETDGNMNTNESGSQQIVDVVDPIWVLGDLSQKDDGIIKLRVKDKYLDISTSTITKDDITVFANGVPSTQITKALTGPVEIVAGQEYEYTLTLSNIEIPGGTYVEFTPTETIVGGTAKYKAENGGNISIQIAAGKVKDQSGNGNKVTDVLNVGNIDQTKPEVYKVQATHDTTNKKVTMVFNVTDRNYDPSDLVTQSEFTIWMDGTQINTINVDSFTSKEIKTTKNDTKTNKQTKKTLFQYKTHNQNTTY